MIEKRLLDRLTRKKTQLDVLRPLPPMAVRRLQERLTIEWIYNSNAIEGNTLTLRETKLILETGLTIGGKSLREHFEVINHKEAIVFTEELAASNEPVTAFQIRQIHELVMMQIDDQDAGKYRNLPVQIAGSAVQPPDAWLLPQLMDDFANWMNGPALTLHVIERAALAHHRLVAIHPFIDGNGRTSRLLMNLLLIRDGYPPTIIRRVNRSQYYRVLAQADMDKFTPLVNFIGRAVEASLTLYLESLIPTEGPPSPDDKWIPLRHAAEGTPYSQEYLSLLARKGRLEAIKRGRNWYTKRRAVTAYQHSVESKK